MTEPLTTDRWAVIGSGPSGVAVDPLSLEGRYILIAVARAGERTEWWDYWIRIIRAKKDVDQRVRVHCPDGSDEEIDSLHKVDYKYEEFVRGSYTGFCDPVGSVAVQWAINHGAKLVEVWGYEGYPTRINHRGTRIMHDRDPSGQFAMQTMRLQACIDTCPDVQFLFHGQMHYELTGENFTND